MPFLLTNFSNVLKLAIVFVIVVFAIPVFGQNNVCIDSTKIDTSRFESECKRFNFEHSIKRPVCGCDSTTYLNRDCANYHGVADYISLTGGCNCIDTSLIDSSYLPDIEVILRRMRRYQMAVLPICACNGKTYLHPNIAVYFDGVTQWTEGPCDCENEEHVDSSYLECVKLVQNNRIGPTNGRDEVNYVCGCDSITYPSSCWAMWYAGVFTLYRGKCSCFDSIKINTSIVCDTIFQPVCGCDSITYDNACIAENHFGIINYQEGPCPCYEELLIDTLARHLNNDPYCRAIKNALDPVCGCDSITYKNECMAEAKYGISYYKPGVCRCIEQETIDTSFICNEIYDPVCACDSLTYQNACIAERYHGINKYGHTPGPCACYSSALQDSTYDCNELSVIDYVCGCDSITYINECVAIKYGGVTSWTPGWCTTKCLDSNLIDTIKFCASVYDPVCGCDSVTYTNECIAFYRYGMTTWTKGECFTSTQNLNEHIDLRIYPNPTNGMFNIGFNSQIDGPFIVDLLNQNGVLLRSQYVQDSNHRKMNIQGFPNGVYFIRVRLKDNQIVVKKIIKI